MKTEEMIEKLFELLEEEDREGDDFTIDCIRNFQDAGLMTREEGIVLELDNGDEFQITIVKSKEYKEEGE